MAKLQIKVASTSQTIDIFIRDSSSTTGAGLTGLVFNAAGLTAYFALPRAASVAITLATLAAVTSAWSSGGFKEIDATNMPGWYRLDLPNAAIASGRFVDIHLQGAANMAPCPVEIELTAVDNQTVNSYGLAATGMDAVLMSDISAVPAITASVKSALNWMFCLARNKRTQTSTTETVFENDGTTTVGTSTKSDDGTTFTRGKYS